MARNRIFERIRSRWVGRETRKATSLKGMAYRSDASCVAVQMTNLSYFGCHLLTDGRFDLSEVITLAMPRMQDLRAQVRWVNEGQAGVRFLHAVHAGDGQTSLGL